MTIFRPLQKMKTKCFSNTVATFLLMNHIEILKKYKTLSPLK
jgi:hypothetical protein